MKHILVLVLVLGGVVVARETIAASYMICGTLERETGEQGYPFRLIEWEAIKDGEIINEELQGNVLLLSFIANNRGQLLASKLLAEGKVDMCISGNMVEDSPWLRKNMIPFNVLAIWEDTRPIEFDGSVAVIGVCVTEGGKVFVIERNKWQVVENRDTCPGLFVEAGGMLNPDEPCTIWGFEEANGYLQSLLKF